MSAILEAFERIADLPTASLVSEEDVKIKVVLPMLRSLGYDDADFNFERRTGRGYVDVVVERFPTGIVVEAKAPRSRLDQYIEQLENYVFHKHARERATIAILTDGESFRIYGVTEAFWKGSLESFRLLSFRRSEINNPALIAELTDLLAKQNNEKRAIPEAILSQRKKRDRLGPIELELRDLRTERQRIDTRIAQLHAEQTSILGSAPSDRGVDTALPAPVDTGPLSTIAKQKGKQVATQHILRLLKDAGADSRSTGVERETLDRELINKVDGVRTHQAISWALIGLRKAGAVDYEGDPIRRVWLK